MAHVTRRQSSYLCGDSGRAQRLCAFCRFWSNRAPPGNRQHGLRGKIVELVGAIPIHSSCPSPFLTGSTRCPSPPPHRFNPRQSARISYTNLYLNKNPRCCLPLFATRSCGSDVTMIKKIRCMNAIAPRFASCPHLDHPMIFRNTYIRYVFRYTDDRLSKGRFRPIQFFTDAVALLTGRKHQSRSLVTVKIDFAKQHAHDVDALKTKIDRDNKC